MPVRRFVLRGSHRVGSNRSGWFTAEFTVDVIHLSNDSITVKALRAPDAMSKLKALSLHSLCRHSS
jgi:hypothetical protein